MDFFVLALATYRISMFLAVEDGVFGIFERMRTGAGVKKDEYGQMYGDNELARMMICMYCNSVWVGVLIAGLYMLFPQFVYVVLPLALSGAVVLVKEIL